MLLFKITLLLCALSLTLFNTNVLTYFIKQNKSAFQVQNILCEIITERTRIDNDL